MKSYTTSEGALRAYYCVELLRSTGEREFPAQLMSVFLWICAHDGCRQEDLTKICNIAPSSVSRCLDWLGPSHRLEHREGLRLIRRERDPENYKAWLLYLTPKGRIFAGLLDTYVNGPLPTPQQHTETKEALNAEQPTDQDVG